VELVEVGTSEVLLPLLLPITSSFSRYQLPQ
jgi:hypothetical protein